MDLIQQKLNDVLNKNWTFKTIVLKTGDNLNLDEINADQNYDGTFWVIQVPHVSNKKCYLVISINRLKRTIICTTTQGDLMDCQLYHKLSNLTENGYLYAFAALRLKCKNNRMHEAFVIYFADMFSNRTFNPISPLLSDKEIRQKYNIIDREQDILDEKVRQWDEMNRLIDNTRHPGLRNIKGNTWN
jgi:hypothetical protein